MFQIPNKYYGVDPIQFQQDCEDMFRLECNEEDLAEFPEARKLYKRLARNRKIISRIEKLQKKLFLNN